MEPGRTTIHANRSAGRNDAAEYAARPLRRENAAQSALALNARPRPGLTAVAKADTPETGSATPGNVSKTPYAVRITNGTSTPVPRGMVVRWRAAGSPRRSTPPAPKPRQNLIRREIGSASRGNVSNTPYAVRIANGTVLGRLVLTLTHRRLPHFVMPTEVGIHAFAVFNRAKAWMLTCVSMTRGWPPVRQSLRRLVLGRWAEKSTTVPRGSLGTGPRMTGGRGRATGSPHRTTPATPQARQNPLHRERVGAGAS